MSYFIVIIVIILVFYLFIVMKGNRQFAAVGIVKAGEGKVETQITLNQNDKSPLLAMALCYLAKIRWLIISEPIGSEKTFTYIFNNTLNNWPDLPYVEMLSSIRKNISEYKVTVFYSRRNGWYVNNDIPIHGYYPGDLVTNYYLLLKNILSELSEDEKVLLGDGRFAEIILRQAQDALAG